MPSSGVAARRSNAATRPPTASPPVAVSKRDRFGLIGTDNQIYVITFVGKALCAPAGSPTRLWRR